MTIMGLRKKKMVNKADKDLLSWSFHSLGEGGARAAGTIKKPVNRSRSEIIAGSDKGNVIRK